MSNFTQQQAEEGFEGMVLTGMSFDRVKLHEGQFKLGPNEQEIGTSFECIIQQTKNLYVVRQCKDQEAKSYYSYDENGDFHTDGTPATETIQEWADDGYYREDFDIKEYLEAVALLVNRDDENDGLMVMLSVPPASKARLAGAAAQAKMRFKTSLSEVIVRAEVGNKVGEGQKSFRPWNFRVLGRV